MSKAVIIDSAASSQLNRKIDTLEAQIQSLAPTFVRSFESGDVKGKLTLTETTDGVKLKLEFVALNNLGTTQPITDALEQFMTNNILPITINNLEEGLERLIFYRDADLLMFVWIANTDRYQLRMGAGWDGMYFWKNHHYSFGGVIPNAVLNVEDAAAE